MKTWKHTATTSKNILLQHSGFNCRIDFYFPKYKLAIEIDEKGHKDRDEQKKIERQKAWGKKLDCKFIRINPDEKYFYMDIEISKIDNHIIESTKKLTKKSLIDKISF